tara:strand:- start:99 stop:278 length:180 start_codon:yes stop_codon:yes gene_type:complete
MQVNESVWSNRLRERKPEKKVETIWSNRLRKRENEIIYNDDLKSEVLEEIETLYKQSKK